MICRSVALSLVLVVLGIAPCRAADRFHAVQCEGPCLKHLQGVCTNNADATYWSLTVLVKTDTEGRVL